ncbi:hypothetical protein [Streptomyces sp. NPDC058583]|uniref:hypothetical protein n=1 Tax=unclassified Streptomyces TaxID=2593676 RepID=UPI00365BFB7F
MVALTVVLSAASFGVGATLATLGNGPQVPAKMHQQRSQNERPAINPQQDGSDGLSAAQQSQIRFKFCNQQAGGPTNVSEVAFMECLSNVYVTDQGQVLPK